MSYIPFHLERFFAATEFTTPHLLAVSDCQTRTVGDLLALEPDAVRRFADLPLAYTDSAGGLELREAVAGRYDGVTVGEVLVHATAVEAIYTTMRALVGPGDRVVVQMPAYQALWGAAAMSGAEVVPWWGRPGEGWAPDLDELPTLLAAPGTRMLVVNSPHNPTGWYADEASLRSIVQAAERAGVRLFCDEAYRGTEFRCEAGPSAVSLSPTAVGLGLVSKGLGLPGLRTGWLVSRDRAVLDRIAGYKDFTSICGSAPSEFLAALALRHADRILDDTRALLTRNLEALSHFMERHATIFSWTPPQAGPVTFASLRDAERWGGAEAFCDRARTEAGVLLAPGPLFGGVEPGSRREAGLDSAFRVGIGRATFIAGLEVLDAWLVDLASRIG
jgi:aspartate/methionine/tyrosine aminotransferase